MIADVWFLFYWLNTDEAYLYFFHLKVQVPERQVDGPEGLPERGGPHGEKTLVCLIKGNILFLCKSPPRVVV